jgi:hypothetical protein
MREHSSRVNREGYTPGDFGRELRALKEQQRAKYDPFQEIYEFLDELCPFYLDAKPSQRAEIRATVSDKRGILSGLRGYVYRAAKRIQSPADREWLRWGLAAASMENCRVDYRDVLLALAELYVSAEEAGIRPRSDFTAVAKLSSTEKPRGGNTPMSEMLANFHSYGALRERRGRRKPTMK